MIYFTSTGHQAELDVDRRRHQPSAAAEFVTKAFYGEAIAYFAHLFDGELYHFAQVELFKDIQTDEFGLPFAQTSFKMEPPSMIEVKAITALVGYIHNSTNKKTYILDRDIIVH